MKELLGFIIGFVVMYLMFAFGQADFNIAKWTEGARHTCAVYGFLFGVVTAAAYKLLEEG